MKEGREGVDFCTKRSALIFLFFLRTAKNYDLMFNYALKSIFYVLTTSFVLVHFGK